MTRSILTGLFAVASVAALGLLPTACSSSGIGDPCVPEDEYNPQFSGFQVTEDNIESRSFQCESRICLVNHFQGRVSCPLGQPPPVACKGVGDNTGCDTGSSCVEAATYAPYCDTKESAATAPSGKTPCPDGFACQLLNKDSNGQGNYCACDTGNDKCASAGTGFKCDGSSQQCKSYVCHTPGITNCQDPNLKAAANAGKSCCIPGSDKPVAGAVCGQCDSKGGRDAANSVYCSCRCGIADGDPAEPNFNFCQCPDGFSCTEIRRDLGIGDIQLSGKYCIKQGTGTTSSEAGARCGSVTGYFAAGDASGSSTSISCKGIQAL